MKTPRADDISRAVIEAVIAVPGVACLRPGLRGLLRTASGRPSAMSGDGSGAQTSAVRVSVSPSGAVTGVDVEIVARAQHRAADVARAVRAAAAGAAAASPVTVKVTVTGIV